MGVNFPDFLVEANRVIKAGGTLFIAEVLSRFTNVSEFVKHMKDEAGFKAVKVSKSNEFFYIMIYQKVTPAS
jgi:ribosomal RNA-processing protein 8